MLRRSTNKQTPNTSLSWTFLESCILGILATGWLATVSCEIRNLDNVTALLSKLLPPANSCSPAFALFYSKRCLLNQVTTVWSSGRMTSFDAEVKFWSTPELVASLFPFLDVASLAKLAQAHKKVARILQDNPSTWKILVKRCCPENRPHDEPCWTRWVGDQLELFKPDVTNLTEILREMKNPKPSMLELLHVICERFPPIFDQSCMNEWGHNRFARNVEFVQLKCPGCPRSPHHTMR